MKNKSNLIILIVLLLFIIGCRETPPFIDFGKKAIGLKDTTYLVSPIPSPANRKIYIEDITGVRCQNCPKAASKIHEIDSMNPGNVIALALYPFFITNLTTPYPGFEILNTNDADFIYTNIYNSPSTIPGGGINRKKYPGETELNAHFNKWVGHTEILKTESTPIVLQTKLVKLDTIANKYTISVKVLFASEYKDEVNLSLLISENKIISQQSMPDGSVNAKYIHNHVLRKAITNFNGLPLKILPSINGNYEAGRVFEKEFDFSIDQKWKRKNCKIVILVNRFDANSKEVLQAAEQDLQ